MSSISGGFKSVNADYSSGEDVDVPAEVGETVPEIVEAVVTRGTVPAGATDALVAMKSSELQSQLMETGLSKTEAKVQAKEIQKTAAEVEELEAELADLQELEAWYEEMLADPYLDYWNASWLEVDLWDIRMDIYEVQDELGRLEGDLQDLLGSCFNGLLGAMETGLEIGVVDQQQNQDKQKLAEMRSGFERTRAELKAKLDQADKKTRELVAEKGFVIPVPPHSDLARKLTKELTEKLSAAKADRTEETLEALRETRKKFA